VELVTSADLEKESAYEATKTRPSKNVELTLKRYTKLIRDSITEEGPYVVLRWNIQTLKNEVRAISKSLSLEISEAELCCLLSESKRGITRLKSHHDPHAIAAALIHNRLQRINVKQMKRLGIKKTSFYRARHLLENPFGTLPKGYRSS